jgi:uncharacterized tellurite resistance protein B-like protein
MTRLATDNRAAARVLALTLLADGRLSGSEREVLLRRGAARQLGLAAEDLHGAIRRCCGDLLAARDPDWDGPCRFDAGVLRGELAAVRGATLRRRLFRLCVELAEADGELSEGEFSLLAAALDQWGIHRGMLDRCITRDPAGVE